MTAELAELNIARMLAPLDSPDMREFVDNLDRINALADESPGFVWRLQDEDGDATALRPFGEDILVNLSVWQDLESLRNFVFRSAHVEIMRQRKSWFASSDEPYLVLWWVEAGHRPTVEEAWQKLSRLREYGASADAFDWRNIFPSP